MNFEQNHPKMEEIMYLANNAKEYECNGACINGKERRESVSENSREEVKDYIGQKQFYREGGEK
ncbi:MAG: hypothetical protein MJZ38_00515 [archaeon]|nr:hypothetical protein [archaeon]